MKRIASILCLLATTGALAATNGYHLKLNLALKGKPVASPEIIVREGQHASITQGSKTDSTFIDVVATEGSAGDNKGIFMKFVVGSINKDGSRTIVSKPQILALANQKAEISVGEKDGPEEISLSVIATPKSL